ncbi:hypothetical protein [Thermoactinomyces sp. DSM 45891]|uniref:hypothetical protein n=1 Tax=Thermoactinomyces sp. DSM 45891 TaxID=1761907 RepID=UPI002570952B|nr:hypothetical protein [Thermoactinomyces sp. DSM 45891]
MSPICISSIGLSPADVAIRVPAVKQLLGFGVGLGVGVVDFPPKNPAIEAAALSIYLPALLPTRVVDNQKRKPLDDSQSTTRFPTGKNT